MIKNTILRNLTFSVVTLALIWSLIWLTLSNTGAEKLETFLAKNHVGDTALQVERGGYPFKLAYTVHHFKTAIFSPEGQTIWHMQSDAPLQFATWAWQPRNISSILNQHSFSFYPPEHEKPAMALKINSAELNYTFADNRNEMSGLFSDMLLQTVGEMPEDLFSAAHLSIKRLFEQNDAGLIDTDVSIDAIQLTSFNKGKKSFTESISFQGGLENYPIHLPYTSNTEENLVEARVRDLAANNARAYLSNLSISSGGLNVNLSGHMRVDSTMRPSGVLTFRTNDINRVLSLIEDEKKLLFLALLGQPTEKEFSLIIEAKEQELLRNGTPIATLPTLTHLILMAQKTL